MVLCFGGTALVLLFDVRGSKVCHAQSQNPLEMLVMPTFPTSATREVRSGDNCDLNEKPQHRSGKNSQKVATPTCCEACDLLWKLTFSLEL